MFCFLGVFLPLWNCCSTVWRWSWGQPDQRSCGGDTGTGRSVPTLKDNPGGTDRGSYKSSENQKKACIFPLVCLCLCSKAVKHGLFLPSHSLCVSICFSLPLPSLYFSVLPVWVTCVSLKLPQLGLFVSRCLLSSLDPRPQRGSGAFAQPGGSNTFSL